MSGDSAESGPRITRIPPFDLIDVVWLILLMVWCIEWCITSASQLGPTFDEPFYLLAGLDGWRTWWAATPAVNGVMPLPVSAVTLPLYLAERMSGNAIDTPLEYLSVARMVTLGWLALLLISALRLGRAAGGPWAGRVAAGLIAADPNFLAHSSLATTDIAVTATLLAFTRAAYVGRGGNWRVRLLVPGLWFGVAVLCKLSALLYGGVILTVLEIAHRYASGKLSRPPSGSIRAWCVRVTRTALRAIANVAAVIVIGIALVVVACGISAEGARPLDTIAKVIPDSEPLKPRYQELAKQFDQVPYAGVAFLFQMWHNSEGRPTFLNGTYYASGVWYYFPVLLLMKTPIPVLVLGVISLLRPRSIVMPLAFVTLALLAVTLTAKLQTGVRLVLPIMAIGYIVVAVAVCRGFGRRGAMMGLVAIAVMAATSAWVWPHGLGYLNQLAGGPSAAHQRVTDSNLDWGQGLPELRAWHRAQGEPPMALWYFGTDPAAHAPPFILIPVEKVPIHTTKDFRDTVGPKLFAVAYTVITLHPHDPPAKAIGIRDLMLREPVARTETFAIYDFRIVPPTSSP